MNTQSIHDQLSDLYDLLDLHLEQVAQLSLRTSDHVNCPCYICKDINKRKALIDEYKDKRDELLSIQLDETIMRCVAERQ